MGTPSTQASNHPIVLFVTIYTHLCAYLIAPVNHGLLVGELNKLSCSWHRK